MVKRVLLLRREVFEKTIRQLRSYEVLWALIIISVWHNKKENEEIERKSLWRNH